MAADFDALLSRLVGTQEDIQTAINAPAFTRFSSLPLELRQLVWHFAVPDDEPEVLILREVNTTLQGQDPTPESTTVDTAFPALMHACHESRDFVLKHSGLRFRFSPKARCEVPFRPFRPELDTVFWNQDLWPYLWGPGFFTTKYKRWLSQLRHLAIASSRAFRGQHLADCIIRHCSELRSLSVVFSHSSAGNWAMSRFVEPQRRHKLRCIPPDRARAMTVLCDAVWCDPEHQITLERFLELFCDELSAHGESFSEPHEDCAGQVWSVQSESDDSCHGTTLRCLAQTFVEWHCGEWVEGYTKWLPPRG